MMESPQQSAINKKNSKYKRLITLATISLAPRSIEIYGKNSTKKQM